ncbi:MAG TPA: acetyl-CoA carboxylase, carboxyltransferase subunit beta [Victivallales bacterium]|nr:acetyl-CoA carboxylase, carboxyltransferase subunit beta [Victivallales bacterium]HRU01240.1 acetyl-CoA carboxylase, carboxyltransferase subunit beta [Victivallales bacterium]
MALFTKEKYTAIKTSQKKEIPGGLWGKCPNCSDVSYKKFIEENLNVCPKCSHHYPMTAQERIKLLTDENSFREIDPSMTSLDPLEFEGVAPYKEKIEKSKAKTGMNEAVICGTAHLNQREYALAVMDFRFLGASMGSVVGEKITRIIELATQKSIPLVIVTASGGARMYEGMISLMQMAKTSGALYRYSKINQPYIVIMTNPTTAGVTASFASLGDILIAEPGALIGFAGPRVIKDTTQATLPEGFQSSEFLYKKGLIDRIVHRKDLKNELNLIFQYFTQNSKSKKNK